ncbi:MAG: hypothetical protein Q9195_009079, partial [Heterodermia aff. obscurata]
MPVISPTSSSRLATSPDVRSSASPQGREYLQERLSQLEQDLKETRTKLSNHEEQRAELQLRNDEHTNKSSASISATDTPLIEYTPSEDEVASSAQAGSDILSDTRKEWLSDILSDARQEWLNQETARLRHDYDTSISQITADLEQKHQAQLRQMEIDFDNYTQTSLESHDKYKKALAEKNTRHKIEIEELRTNLQREHKVQLDTKASNIRANYTGVLAKKDTQIQQIGFELGEVIAKKEAQLQQRTSELASARQAVIALKKSVPRNHQHHVFENLKSNLKRDHQASLDTKTREIRAEYSGIIAKKDAQYQELSKEFEDAQQALGRLQAESTLAKQDDKARLRAEQQVEIEALRGEMLVLKSENAELKEKLKASLDGERQLGEVVDGGVLNSDPPTALHETELKQVRAMNAELVKIVAKIEAV